MAELEHGEGILIAGGGGMIGSHLARAADGRAITPGRSELDWRDGKALGTCLRRQRIGLVVDARGAAGQPWREQMEVQAFLARTLAEAAEEAGAALVYLSTSRVFSGLQEGPYLETDQPDPRDDYGLSKFLGERYVQAAVGRHYILRLPMVLGRRPGDPGRQLATRLLAQARAGGPVRVAEDVFTQALHAADIAPCITRLLAESRPPGIYHLSSTPPVSLHRIIARLFAHCGLPLPEAVPARTLQATGHLALNLALAPGRLGPLSPWEQAVDRFAADLDPR